MYLIIKSIFFSLQKCQVSIGHVTVMGVPTFFLNADESKTSDKGIINIELFLCVYIFKQNRKKI